MTAFLPQSVQATTQVAVQVQQAQAMAQLVNQHLYQQAKALQRQYLQVNQLQLQSVQATTQVVVQVQQVQAMVQAMPQLQQVLQQA